MTMTTTNDDDEEGLIRTGFDFAVDATGTFGHSNHLGAGGGPAIGELSLIRYTC